MEDWLEISISAPPENLDAVAAYLTAENVGGLFLEEESDFHRYLEEFRQHWDYVDEALLRAWEGRSRVKFYLPNTTTGQLRLKELRSGLTELSHRMNYAPDALSVSVSALDSEDWENGWRQYYRPIPVGERLYIVPAWERETEIPSGRIPLLLNPGLIFGTGSHASTRLCLESLERHIHGGEYVLDLGCGSGILSIASLLLGAGFAAGCDIDEKAEGIVRENAGYNAFGPDRLSVHIGDILQDRRLVAALTQRKARIILANIVADVIIPLSKQARNWLSEDGVFICSGIIDTRADEVAAALRANGYLILERNERDGWVSFTAR